jgi:hypothetical protein
MFFVVSNASARAQTRSGRPCMPTREALREVAGLVDGYKIRKASPFSHVFAQQPIQIHYIYTRGELGHKIVQRCRGGPVVTCAVKVWASCAATVVFPTPPFPLSTITMFFTDPTPLLLFDSAILSPFQPTQVLPRTSLSDACTSLDDSFPGLSSRATMTIFSPRSACSSGFNRTPKAPPCTRAFARPQLL